MAFARDRILMFGTLQGDQFLVATFYTMTDLGPYAAAAALTMAPSFVFGRVFNSVMLPLMAKVQDEPATFRHRYRQATAVIVTFAAVCAAGMIIGSEALMVLVYGPKYAGAGIIMAWLAASNAYRNLRISPALAAMAKGDSQNQMISNLWRVVALVPTLALAVAQYPVWMLACTGVLGELLACRAAWVRLSRRDGVPLSMNLVSGVWVTAAVIFAFGITALGVSHWNPYLAVSLAAACSFGIGAGMVMTMPVLRHEVATLWLKWRQTGLRGLVQRA
jgi:O-antigen/teichoic acid export membrane protein